MTEEGGGGPHLSLERSRVPIPSFFGWRLMLQVQQVCACGKKYWPSQRWVQKKGGVVTHKEPVTTATTGVVKVVVKKRTKDRHKNKEARREYLRLKMREHRAKRRGSPK